MITTMALIDNYGTNNGGSRLFMMQARFQQRQQEEKEHKLFTMLEEQHDVPMVGGPTHTGSRNHSSNSHNTNVSSNASLSSSSMASSLASSLGSTGCGAGKVRQMFEERRGGNVNGRPPIAAVNTSVGMLARGRRASPTKGYDRSYPLEPLDRNQITLQQQQQRYVKPRGVSLERGSNADYNNVDMRRSKSQYLVYQNNGQRPGMEGRSGTLTEVRGAKPRSMNSLIDDNQNDIVDSGRKTAQRYGYPPAQYRNPSETRYRDTGQGSPNYRDVISSNENLSNGDATRHNMNQTYRKLPMNLYRAVNSADGMNDDSATAAALVAAQVAAETARKLEQENAKILEQARRREDELLSTIRQQQIELQRLQQAAALAQQKAKVSAAAVPTSRNTGPKARKPVTENGARQPWVVAMDESDDSKSSTSDSVTASPTKRFAPTIVKKNGPASPEKAMTKPKIAPKPNVAGGKNPSATRRSIFSTGAAAEGLVSCSICGRNFASDRIEKHESVCAKTKSKKRKVFDITKMRVKGTEAEGFVLNNKVNQQPTANVSKKPQGNFFQQQQVEMTQSRANLTTKSTVPEQSNDENSEAKKPDWKRKHENFLETIRAAKAVTKHLKAGGKISDLPPPPPSDTSDYIQCPHCKRRFSPGAADRHIPKCANIKSNKPK